MSHANIAKYLPPELVALSWPSLQFLDIRYNGFEGNCETIETPSKSNQSPVLGSTPAPTLIYKPNNAPTQGLTGSNAAVAVAVVGVCGCGWLRFLSVRNGLNRFVAVCMIVSKRCQPLPTAKTAFTGGSGETSQTLGGGTTYVLLRHCSNPTFPTRYISKFYQKNKSKHHHR
ncbi:hypothetical protein YC2023_061718 [Brassica napus]